MRFLKVSPADYADEDLIGEGTIYINLAHVLTIDRVEISIGDERWWYLRFVLTDGEVYYCLAEEVGGITGLLESLRKNEAFQ